MARNKPAQPAQPTLPAGWDAYAKLAAEVEGMAYASRVTVGAPTPEQVAEATRSLVRARARIREALTLLGTAQAQANLATAVETLTAPAPAPVATVAPTPTAPAPAPTPAPERKASAGSTARLPMRECDNATLVAERLGPAFPTVKRKIAVSLIAKRLAEASLIADTEAREIVRLAGKDVSAAEAQVTALVTGAQVAGVAPAPIAPAPVVAPAPEGEVASEFANL